MKINRAVFSLCILVPLYEEGCMRKPPKMTPHTDAKACAVCHVEKDTMTHEVAAELKKDPVALCSTCHPKGVQDHKMDIVPTRPMPPNLPLSTEGKLVCHTCHDPHGKTKERAALRMEANALCMACHADK